MPVAGVTPECTEAEQNMLTTFGLQSSRLDAPDTIATLLSASVNVVKPAHCVWRGNSASNADRYGSPVLASHLYQKSRLCGAAGLGVVR